MKIPNNLIGLDFETYGAADLPKVALHNYVNDPTFQPLLAAAVWNEGGEIQGRLMDFVEDYDEEKLRLEMLLEGMIIVAHNAGFEQAVLKQMGIDLPSSRFIDSAVLARIAGAAGKLEAAGPQLLGIEKLESGWPLIQKFSMPRDKDDTTSKFDPQMREDNLDDWAEFARYCAMDAEIGLKLALRILPMIEEAEMRYMHRTMDMNQVGWHVDRQMVDAMLTRYEANLTATINEFRTDTDEWDLNLASSKQVQEWCDQRGIHSDSFDEAHVAKLLTQVEAELAKPKLPSVRRLNLWQVHRLLTTKQAMGGSSLKKLYTLVNQTGEDSRLYDAYLHAGAGATLRTTGRGVQMQNLPRLNGEADDMAELLDDDIHWSNDRMAHNLRQVFTASHPDGQLIVGDFSAVESRGLAWQAGEQWKIDAYFAGEDLYKRLEAQITGKALNHIGKAGRTHGKVGELSCGYGAGAETVRQFSERMGMPMSQLESRKMVRDWRAVCPRTVEYWYGLEDALRAALRTDRPALAQMAHGSVQFKPVAPPLSLMEQAPDSRSIIVTMANESGRSILTRVIHGVRASGREITYYKPSERKTGDLWRDRYTDPKTGQTRRYTLYGGKLAGLMTQSLCREVFFGSLDLFANWVEDWDNVRIVGQFHDELVVDWVPGQVSLEDTVATLHAAMTTTVLPGFPLAAEIKHDYRYTK